VSNRVIELTLPVLKVRDDRHDKVLRLLNLKCCFRSGPWLPISSSPFANGLWPLHTGIFIPIVLKTSATSSLPLYLVPSI
jgi:hypothetical protein